jgi:hypothetical protein
MYILNVRGMMSVSLESLTSTTRTHEGLSWSHVSVLLLVDQS